MNSDHSPDTNHSTEKESTSGGAALPLGPLPRHIAIIMDGNGRWARRRGLPRLEGHRAGALSVQKIVRECRRTGIRHLTLFSFSTENWNRSTDEVGGLMKLFSQYLDSELDELVDGGVRLLAVGDLGRLPFAVRKALERDIKNTAHNTAMDLILAISYGAREEIVRAAKVLAAKVAAGTLHPEQIDQAMFAASLWTAGIPDPDLLIRTSGEMRVSNFLLWQLAYSEIVVSPELWPDFDEAALQRCITEYRRRERRFGLTTEQLRGQTPSTGGEISRAVPNLDDARVAVRKNATNR